VFIGMRTEAEALADAKALEREGDKGRPLFGIPVAVKDNIDAAGLATTAACPDYSYQPQADATAVARLRQAGAIIIGKTNLDQFATGLNGTRSPYGVPRNPLKPDLIPGGSSSGSAVAVAAGLVPLALGTDTAGSGRVPAMLNNIVGLKPSLGLISTYGVVPACRTLDCVSVFALTVDDAFTALKALAGPDVKDAYSRAVPLGALGTAPAKFTVGVPAKGARVFFGDTAASAAYEAALARLRGLGATIVEIDIEPFYETARLLYEGPWVAERLVTVRNLLASSPQSLNPVVREIVKGGAGISATDVFATFYKLEDMRRVAAHTFRNIDVLVVPTAPQSYTVAQMLADPIQLNSRLGTYTNFTNLLDLCGLAVPASLAGDKTPFGITLLAPSGRDAMLASIGRKFHADTQLMLGALRVPQPPLAPLPVEPAGDEIAIAVVGAHLSGMALNGQLRDLNGRFLETVKSAADYKLYALANAQPAKPGMLRVAKGAGKPLELEIWALSAAAFGKFVAEIPPPMAIGTVALADGRSVKGFLVEPEGLVGARDITEFGGWRAFVASETKA
jgi:allophanate hydrolase